MSRPIGNVASQRPIVLAIFLCMLSYHSAVEVSELRIGLTVGGTVPLRCRGLWNTETERDWDKFIQHNMTLYRCMISAIHGSSYALFNTNLISNTSLHVGRPLLRPFLVAYAEATLARQKKIAQQPKSVDIISEYLLWTNGQLFEMNVKKWWVPIDRLEKPLIPCNMISN